MRDRTVPLNLQVRNSQKSLTQSTETEPQKEPLVGAPANDTLKGTWSQNSPYCEDHAGKPHIEHWHQEVDALQLSDGDKGDGGQNGAAQGNQAGSYLRPK